MNKNMKKYLFIFIMVVLSIYGCKRKKLVKAIEVNGVKDSNYNNLNTLLRTLPNKDDKNSESSYVEINSFLLGRDAVMSKRYKEGFDILASFLDIYPSSFYEPEASYLLGLATINMLESEPSYIETVYKRINEEAKKRSKDSSSDRDTEEFSMAEVYKNLGITSKDGKLTFNGAPLSRIARDTSSTFLLKDYAYFFSISNRFSKIEGEEDKNKFISNVKLLTQFSDRYRTSHLQEIILTNTEYFPNHLPFNLNRTEYKEYSETIDTVNDRIKDIYPRLNEYAYVIGNGIIIRDRIPTTTSGTEKELYVLNNYEYVKVLNRKTVKNTRTREEDNWLLVEYDTYYGPVIGWSYAQYFTNDNNLSEVFEIFRSAMKEYNQYNYLEASDLYSKVLSYPKNYFTDKAAYLLWRVNNKIAELVTSKNNEYYDYVVAYPKYFYYNTSTSTLHSSTLLYNYLIKVMPDSQYKFKISSDSDTDYSVE